MAVLFFLSVIVTVHDREWVSATLFATAFVITAYPDRAIPLSWRMRAVIVAGAVLLAVWFLPDPHLYAMERRGMMRYSALSMEVLRIVSELTGLARIQSAWLAPVVASAYVAAVFVALALIKVRLERMTHLSRGIRAIASIPSLIIGVCVVIVLFPLSLAQGFEAGLAGDWRYLAYVVVLFGIAFLGPIWVIFARHREAADAT